MCLGSNGIDQLNLEGREYEASNNMKSWYSIVSNGIDQLNFG